MSHLEKIFPAEVAKYSKLLLIRDKVGRIKEVEEYEQSERAVKEFCPKRYF